MGLNEQQRASQAQFDRNKDNYGRQHILAQTNDLEVAFAQIPESAGICNAGGIATSSPQATAAHGRQALDVATGGGHAALFAARRGWQMTLGDIAAGMLENARKLLAEEGFEAKTAQFPAETFPFADGSFSLVTCRVAAHHFSDPAAFVQESARVLHPGGYFVLIDGSLPDDSPEVDAWLNAVEKWRDPSHGRLISRKEWTGYADAAGLEIISAALTPFLQPDLEWYFKTANTSAANRQRVLEAIATAPPAVRQSLCLQETDGKVTWQWQRLHLVARKPAR